MRSTVKKLAIYAGTVVIMASVGNLAWAGSVTIPNSFVSGTPAKAADVNANFSAVQTAVDDNDARITAIINNTQTGALQTAITNNTDSISGLTTTVGSYTADISNLKGNLANGSCRANDGTVDANAVRVGPLCVDKYRARLTIGSCATDGTGAGCNGIVAQSTATGSAATSMSWAQAVRVCANSGKRLPTPGEWMMAYTVGTASEMTGLEWVDSVSSVMNGTASGTASATNSASFTYPAGSYPAGTPQAVTVTIDPITIPSIAVADSGTDPIQVGYMGPRSGTIQFFANANFDDNTSNFIYFRCVR